ncbi:molybdenum ABC transporter ATP-binding protein [Ancylobacter sp. 6x-1]|uniref:Molybdenum ABC transporter ATP-binding protein n=1 Tax=Ancylobacter crimeensis TaxID=2579147 RepID=A0ABT0D841_9HYPH|nr:molybdenum ABC transporter ATP-binding protein [Ancylobacter crimeensis]MCK0196117.1 molybdenum ABC transporter ATP-binding protein [Ancylobacter crimeensis]
MTLDIHLKHTFPTFSADVDICLPTPGVTALFGPSGCGKSTVMSAVSGLLKADEVRVVLDGVVLSDLHPADRGVGVVFQDGRLFPHMTVDSNLRYGMKRAQAGPVDFAETVELLGIGHLLDRRPGKLSGGERQRVAIGRALLRQPRLLLMDEPLSALDAGRKDEILPFLTRLHDDMRIPMLLVTHSIDEVARLADTLVLMRNGSVVAQGPVGDILTRADLDFASANQAGAVIAARIVSHDPTRGLTKLDAGGVMIWIPMIEEPPSARRRIRVPASEVSLALDDPGPTSADNIVSGVVLNLRETPDRRMTLVEIAAGQARLLSQLTPDAARQLRLEPDMPVKALFKAIGVQVV